MLVWSRGMRHDWYNVTW